MSDTIEPYNWEYTGQADVLAWVENVGSGEITLTLSDESTPQASAPIPTIAAVATGDENTTVQLSATVPDSDDTNPYDAIDYDWSVSGGTLDDATAASPTWTRPAVTADTDFDIDLTITARGTGTNAADGTSDTADAAQRSATVENDPVVTTDTDSIYRLGDRDTTPATPTGGTSDEDHLPAGWTTRSEPDPTETQAVYRSQRTRSYSDGNFTSATAWGAPTRIADRLLLLSDWSQPTDTESLVLALWEVDISGVDLVDAPGDVVGTGNDLALADDLSIDMVERHVTGSQGLIRLRRTGTGSFSTYIDNEGTPLYPDAKMYIQTSPSTVIPFTIAGTGGGFNNWNIDNASDRAAIEALANGDRFILAITTPSVEDHTVNAGDVSWAFAVGEPTVTYVAPASHAVDAGDVAWAFEATEPTVTYTAPQDHAVDAGDIAWAFSIPEPTVTYREPGDTGVNAGDVAWAFEVVQPTVTYTAPDSDSVDAGDASWAFAIPQPTVTYTPPLDHAVNAGDVSWGFDLPEPTVTYVGPAQDHTVDAGDVSWAFQIPQPRVTYSPPVPPITGLLEILVELHLDSGVRRYSRQGIASENHWWEPRLVAVPNIERAISVLPRDYEVSSLSIAIADPDNVIATLKAEESFRRRKVVVLLGDLAKGEADFQPVATGLIDSWNFAGNIFTVSAVDEIFSQLDEPVISPLLDHGLFPFIPSDEDPPYAPILIGEIATDTGAMPAYLVDPGQDQSKYRYVAAKGELHEISKVFLYGVEVDSADYVVQTIDHSGHELTVIDFDSDQRDPDRSRELEITWNGTGWQDSGGDAIRNPVRIMRAFLEDQGYQSTKTALFDRQAQVLDARLVTGTLVITSADQTLRSVLSEASESWNVSVWYGADGEFGLSVPEPVRQNPTVDLVLDEGRILAGGLSISATDEYASDLILRHSLNGVTGRLEGETTLRSVRQQSALGEVIRQRLDLPFARTGTAVSAIGNDKLFFLRENRHLATVAVDPRILPDVELGDVVRLTHWAGLGTEGFRGKLFRLVGVGASFSTEQFLCHLRMIDVEELAFSQSALWMGMVDDDGFGTWTTRVGWDFNPQSELPDPV